LIPFLFVYGFGGIFIGYLYKNYPDLSFTSKIILFFVVFNLMELLSGIIVEKFICKIINTCAFDNGKRMWDYKNNFGNLNGYIDIEHSIIWVVLGMVGYYMYPFLMNIPGWKLFICAVIIWFIITMVKINKESNKICNY